MEIFKTDHTVPSCGYVVRKNKSALLITADTYSLDNMIEMVQKDPDITAIVVECSFPSSMESLARESKHLTPQLLFEKIKVLENRKLHLYINHIKPLYKEIICSEITALQGPWETTILDDGDKISF